MATKPITATRTSIGNDLKFCPAGTEIEGTIVGKDFKPTKDSKEYQKIGDCIDYQHQTETEDDPITAYTGPETGWETQKNTTVTSDSFVFNMAEVSQIFWEIDLRADGELVTGQEVTPLVKQTQGIEGWLLTEKFDNANNKLMTLEVYGVLKAESPTEDNKIVKPQYTLEVIKSPLQVVTPESGVGYEA